MKAVIGIDPGTSKTSPGAMALVAADGTIDVLDWIDGPTMASKMLEWKQEYTLKHAILERVHAMPKQGVSSTFKLGENFGFWQGLLCSFGIPFETVPPQKWMKTFSLKKSGPTDKPGLPCARQLFPAAELHLKKHSGRADGLLMAEHGRRTTNAFRS